MRNVVSDNTTNQEQKRNSHGNANDFDGALYLTTKLTDRHNLTYEKKKLQGKSPSANGGSVQRPCSAMCSFNLKNLRPNRSVLAVTAAMPRCTECNRERRETHEK